MFQEKTGVISRKNRRDFVRVLASVWNSSVRDFSTLLCTAQLPEVWDGAAVGGIPGRWQGSQKNVMA